MRLIKLLICGTKGKFKGYKELVYATLKTFNQSIEKLEFIEGCCKDSADQYAEEYASMENIPISHFPATEGNYLKRNIEMVKKCDMVIAFWDGWSYGTAHTLAQAMMRKKAVSIIPLKEVK